MGDVNVGDKIPLTFFLEDEATGKFVEANVYDADGAEITGSPITMSEVAGGIYEDDSLDMPDTSKVVAKFKAYNEVGLTTLYNAFAGSGTYLRNVGATDVISKLDTIISALTGFSGSFSNVTATIELEPKLNAIIEEVKDVKAIIETDVKITESIKTDVNIETKIKTDTKIKANLEEC